MVGRVSINNSEVREKTFGLTDTDCWLEITIITQGTPQTPVTATTTVQDDGTCVFTYNAKITVIKECKCMDGEPKTSFRWVGGGDCAGAGNTASYPPFSLKFYLKADGTCPPEPKDCSGLVSDTDNLEVTLNQIGCRKNPCRAKTSHGIMSHRGMKAAITAHFAAKIREEYGDRTAKCPGDDTTLDFSYLFN